MLKITLSLALLILPLGAADLSGQWSATLTSNGRTIPLHFEFHQQPGKLLGAFGPRADFLTPLASLRLDGSTLWFEFQLPLGPVFRFQGQVDGDTVSGALTAPAPTAAAKLEMKRTRMSWRLPSTVGTPADTGDLAALSDEFDEPRLLKNWRTLSESDGWPPRIEKADVNVSNAGQFTVVPQSGAWWAGYHGVYFFKEVKGDFTITTRVKVTGKTGDEPSQIWTISGLLLRAPADPAVPREQRLENWIYVMTGRGPRAERVIDAKSTVNNNNAWDITPAQSGWYDLRLARIGPLFLAFCRPDGGEWTLRKRIVREDLPATLQAGINVTSDFKLSATMPALKYNADLFPASSPDSLTTFDFVRFSRSRALAEFRRVLAGRKLIDISDSEILAFFR